MATIKLTFRASLSKDKEDTLYYQVIHKQVARQICTGYKIFPSEWNKDDSRIIFQPSIDDKRHTYLMSIAIRIKKDMTSLESIAKKLKQTGKSYCTDDIVSQFAVPSIENGFISFCYNLILQMSLIGKERTAETYKTALNSFIRFRCVKDDVPLKDLDSSLIMEYESYLKSRGICPNSSSFYMRNLRAMYNRAVDKEIIQQKNPFKHVYTGIDKTVKRAISIKSIRQIRDLDLVKYPSSDYARDMFLFSFYTRGMSFVDMAYLKKNNLKNGFLSYRRHKTNQQLFVKWEKPMQDIVDKYDTSNSPYLLPIIKNSSRESRRQYVTAEHLVNCKLKRIGKSLGLSIPLTTYVARHSWASIAKSKNIPLSIISEAMGHDSESTTRIYLASLDTSTIDRANKIVLKSL